MTLIVDFQFRLPSTPFEVGKGQISSIANLLASGPAELTAGKTDTSFGQETYLLNVVALLCSCHDRNHI